MNPFPTARPHGAARPVRSTRCLRAPSILVANAAFTALLAAQQAPATQDPKQGDDDKRAALARALAELEQQPAGEAPVPGAPTGTVPPTPPGLGAIGAFNLLDLSFDVMVAGGASTEPDASLENLQAGGHDPRKRGFTLQQAELGLKGAVDAFFRAEAYLVYFIDPYDGESRFELEEAFATTTDLPYGLELEAGQFFTEFGRHNPRHPHSWDFLDAPVIHTRLFGPDGMRGTGARAGWLTPLPWYAELHAGVQNANGETMASFLANEEFFAERPVGGRPFVARDVQSLADVVYLLRFVQSWDVADTTTVALGGSALFGPNATGPAGDTRVYGADLVVRWSDGVGGREARELVWETEFALRDYRADAFAEPSAGIAIPADTLRDQGFYSQLAWRLAPEWRVGARYDRATGSGAGWDQANAAMAPRSVDPFRDDRERWSTMLEWRATEFSRVRLQYNYDRADHLGDGGDGGDAHSVWLGLEVSLGSHPAHRF